jgi:hypothetical protein
MSSDDPLKPKLMGHSVSYFQRMIEVVGNLDFTGDPVDDFADGAFVILAAALSKLPDARREAYLANIEGGDLRKAAKRFDVCRPSPHPTIADWGLH